jgi:hypothetical protein
VDRLCAQYTEALLEKSLGGVFFDEGHDEMHNPYESGYSRGDPYGNPVINTCAVVRRRSCPSTRFSERSDRVPDMSGEVSRYWEAGSAVLAMPDTVRAFSSDLAEPLSAR